MTRAGRQRAAPRGGAPRRDPGRPGQRITFARFMERALTEPGLGYYATSDLRPTRDGDFLTAPELHPFFGRCLGRFLAGAWKQAGSPDRYVVREHGAGRGTLRETALAGLEADGSRLAGRLEWQRVDLPGRSDATDGARRPRARQRVPRRPAGPSPRPGAAASARPGSAGATAGSPRRSESPPTRTSRPTWRPTASTLREGQRAEVCLAAPRWLAAGGRDARRDGASSSSSTTATRRSSSTAPGAWPDRC